MSPHLHSLAVQCGYSFDGRCHDVDGYHVDYARDTIQTDSTHDISIKALGVDSLRWFQIGFGVPKVGAPVADAEASMLVKVQRNYSQQHAYNITGVSCDNKNNIIGQNATVTVSAAYCMDGDQASRDCVRLDICGILFREQMHHEPFVIQVADENMRVSTNYMNEGILVQGPSMNPVPRHVLEVRTTSQGPADTITLYRTDKLGNLWTSDAGHIFTQNDMGVWVQLEHPAYDMSSACSDEDNRLCDAFDRKLDWHTADAESLRDSLYGDIYLIVPFDDLADPVTVKGADIDSRTMFLIENGMMWVRD